MQTLLDIVIVTWNSHCEIFECLRALHPHPKDWSITVVDNASADDTVDIVREHFPEVTIIQNTENLGFAKANNQVIERTDSDFFLSLNPDTIASVSAIQTALDRIRDIPNAGLLGVKILESDGSLQPSCQRFPRLSSLIKYPVTVMLVSSGIHRALPEAVLERIVLSDYLGHDSERRVDAVLGAFMLVTRRAINAVGGMPAERFLYGEEIDWSYRMLQKGYETWFTPAASIVHHGNRSGSQRSSEWQMSLMLDARYAFCKNNYGETKMKTIRFIDLMVFTARRVYHSLSGNSAKHAFAVLNQKIIWRMINSKGPPASQSG